MQYHVTHTHTHMHKHIVCLLHLTFYIHLYSSFHGRLRRRLPVLALIYSPKVQSTTLKCLLTTGIKHNCQLGVEVRAPNGLV